MAPLSFWSFGVSFVRVRKKMKNGTSFVLHNFVDVGVKKDIHSERERERETN